MIQGYLGAGQAETPEIRAQLQELRLKTVESNYSAQKRMTTWAIGLGAVASALAVVALIKK